jgi:hypothetical protein
MHCLRRAEGQVSRSAEQSWAALTVRYRLLRDIGHRQRMQRRHLLYLACANGLAIRPARALEAPESAVVLTLTGRLRSPNRLVGGEPHAVFDMSMIERMPQSSFTTRTPWYSQPRTFTGPLLRDVLAAVAAQGSILRASALNDYRVDIPWRMCSDSTSFSRTGSTTNRCPYATRDRFSSSIPSTRGVNSARLCTTRGAHGSSRQSKSHEGICSRAIGKRGALCAVGPRGCRTARSTVR